jgi:hypothetical protein
MSSHRKNFKDVSVDLKSKIKQNCLNKIKMKRENKTMEERKETSSSWYLELIQQEFNEENIYINQEEIYEMEMELKREEELILKEYEKHLTFEQEQMNYFIETMFDKKNE